MAWWALPAWKRMGLLLKSMDLPAGLSLVFLERTHRTRRALVAVSVHSAGAGHREACCKACCYLPPATLQHTTGWLVAGSGTGPIWLWDLARCVVVPSMSSTCAGPAEVLFWATRSAPAAACNHACIGPVSKPLPAPVPTR